MEFLKQVYNSRLVTAKEVKSLQLIHNNQNGSPPNMTSLNKYSVRLQYNTKEQFKLISKSFGLMDDFKVTNF